MVRTKTVLTYARRAAVVSALLASVGFVASAQSADDAAVAEYAALLEQIANLETTIAHKEVYVSTQQAEIAALEKQIAEVPAIIEAVGPMLDKMKAAIGNEIESDLPFNAVERFDRLAGLDEILADQNARPADKMRRALGIYDAEVSYGQTIQSYAGDHPVQAQSGQRLTACRAEAMSAACALSKEQIKKITEDKLTVDDFPGELKDGDYLRYGRLSLAYMTADGGEILRYDPTSKAWEVLSGSRALDVRRAMKMAKGEAAPTVVEAPIYLAN